MNAAAPIEISFEHRQSAHCESGAIAALLRHAGLPISEPMAFGIAGALSYAYLPFVKFGGLPLFAYRTPPGRLIRNLTRRLGVPLAMETFKRPDAGMRALDDHLAAGRVVGLQASAYWLTYFPPDMRFHFNAHNLIVYGKRGPHYLIADPVIDIRVECAAADLRKARFTRGVMAPHGRLYYPRAIPRDIDWRHAIHRAIRVTAGMMLHTPLPIVGVRGIRTVAHKVRRLDPRHDHANRLLLGHIVRMQEEIGTGGAGFRFLYAAFLQEAAAIVHNPALVEIARELTRTGDAWREFALHAARMCKDRVPIDYAHLADQLEYCARGEKRVFRRLRAELK